MSEHLSDWAVRIDGDAIELAEQVTIHRMTPEGREYAIVRAGEIVSLTQDSGRVGLLLDSVATDDPVPSSAWEAWRARTLPIVI